MNYDITIIGSKSRIYSDLKAQINPNLRILEISRDNYDELSNNNIVYFGSVFVFAMSNDIKEHVDLISFIQYCVEGRNRVVYYLSTTLNLLSQNIMSSVVLPNYAVIKLEGERIARYHNWSVIFLGFHYTAQRYPFQIGNSRFFLCSKESNVPLLNYEKFVRLLNLLEVPDFCQCFEPVTEKSGRIYLLRREVGLIRYFIKFFNRFKKFELTLLLRTFRFRYEDCNNR